MIYVPDSLLPVLDSRVQDFTTDLVIQVEEDSDDLRQQLFSLTNGTPVEVISLQDKADIVAASMQEFNHVMLGARGFIVVFSLINLTNTLLTNLLARQRGNTPYSNPLEWDGAQLKQTGELSACSTSLGLLL